MGAEEHDVQVVLRNSPLWRRCGACRGRGPDDGNPALMVAVLTAMEFRWAWRRRPVAALRAAVMGVWGQAKSVTPRLRGSWIVPLIASLFPGAGMAS